MYAGTSQGTGPAAPGGSELPPWIADLQRSLAARPRVPKWFLSRMAQYLELVRSGFVARPPASAPEGLELFRYLRLVATAGWRMSDSLTGLFDPRWYLNANPDVADAGMNPAIHFAKHGMSEGRDPCPLFSSGWYAQKNPQVRKSGLKPFAHYRLFGGHAGLSPHPLFDPAWYLKTYPDVARTGLLPLEHFLSIGWKKAYDPNAWFSTRWYLERYGQSLEHPNPVIDYLLGGAAAGRDPSARFSTSFYLAEYDDVAQAQLNPLVHFLSSGLTEGRAPLPLSNYRRITLMPEILQTRPQRKTTLPSASRREFRSAEPRINALKPGVTVNWVVMPDNHGWAYGNNAKRLSQALSGFTHDFDRQSAGDDIALYFDIRIFKKVGRLGRANVLRVGGRRPLDIQYGDRWQDLEADLQNFDAVIALNSQLRDIVAPFHNNVVVIPNGVDCDAWRPAPDREARPFTVGFAGNLTTGREREVKGFSYVQAACEKLGLPLKTLQKSKNQIAHEDMPREFYGKIDCLVHPVGEGKEGSSNVIMEALALGVPVITTRHCGFHAEHLVDGESVLYCERDSDNVASRIEQLMHDPALAKRMSLAGRAFAEEHHGLPKIAEAYRRVLKDVAVRRFGVRLSFVPFWSPPENFASSRLRCLQPMLQLESSATISASIGYQPESDVVVVSQLASDEVMKAIAQNRDQFVIYDICDRYHVDDRMIGGVHAATRFGELATRADIIVASTLPLKMEISELLPGKPVLHIPDGIDYGGAINPVPTPPSGPVVWFGNPGRGNFESARPLLDIAKNELGRPVKLVSRKRSFATDPEYRDLCIDWRPDTFVDELREGGVCIVTHAENEPLKSPNRLVTAVANGVPTLAYRSPACEAVLEDAACSEGILHSENDLEPALIKFSDPQFRADYLRKLQDFISLQFGPERMRGRYEHLLTNCTWRKQSGSPLRVMFVSHNLQFGEGAPTSLYQTVLGLKQICGIDAVVYSPLDGDLRAKYEEKGIPVWLSKNARRSRTLVGALGKNYAREVDEFSSILEQEQIDALLCNTAKTLFYARAGERLGIPALTVIRESSDEHVNMSFASGEMMADSERVLRHGKGLVFVSEFTRQLWQQNNALAPTTVIPNGIHVEQWEPLLHAPVADARAALNLDPSETIILCVGTITPRKGQSDLVQAFAQLPEQVRQNARVILVGARPSRYLDELMAFLDSLPPEVSRQVTIVEETADIGPWYRAADLFVLASYNESYPRVVVEAMFFGLPVISSAVFGAKEQVVDGVSGLLFEAGDISQLGIHLTRLLDDIPFRQHMSQRSQSRFWELCTFEEMVVRYASLLFNVTSAPPNPVPSETQR